MIIVYNSNGSGGSLVKLSAPVLWPPSPFLRVSQDTKDIKILEFSTLKIAKGGGAEGRRGRGAGKQMGEGIVGAFPGPVALWRLCPSLQLLESPTYTLCPSGVCLEPLSLLSLSSVIVASWLVSQSEPDELTFSQSGSGLVR